MQQRALARHIAQLFRQIEQFEVSDGQREEDAEVKEAKSLAYA